MRRVGPNETNKQRRGHNDPGGARTVWYYPGSSTALLNAALIARYGAGPCGGRILEQELLLLLLLLLLEQGKT